MVYPCSQGKTDSKTVTKAMNLLMIKGKGSDVNDADDRKTDIVQVKASAQLKVPPDRAQVCVSVLNFKPTAKEAKESVARRREYILQTLKNYGVEDVTSLDHLSRHENGFQMMTEIIIRFDNLAKCLDIMNLFVEKLDRSVTVVGPEFDHGPNTVETARKDVFIRAAKSAQLKANELARECAADLSSLISMIEEKSSCHLLLPVSKDESESGGYQSCLIQNRIDAKTVMVESQINARFALAQKKMVRTGSWILNFIGTQSSKQILHFNRRQPSFYFILFILETTTC